MRALVQWAELATWIDINNVVASCDHVVVLRLDVRLELTLGNWETQRDLIL